MVCASSVLFLRMPQKGKGDQLPSRLVSRSYFSFGVYVVNSAALASYELTLEDFNP